MIREWRFAQGSAGHTPHVVSELNDPAAFVRGETGYRWHDGEVKLYPLHWPVEWVVVRADGVSAVVELPFAPEDYREPEPDLRDAYPAAEAVLDERPDLRAFYRNG